MFLKFIRLSKCKAIVKLVSNLHASWNLWLRVIKVLITVLFVYHDYCSSCHKCSLGMVKNVESESLLWTLLFKVMNYYTLNQRFHEACKLLTSLTIALHLLNRINFKNIFYQGYSYIRDIHNFK
jgi:hypothetical protein